MPYVWLVLAVLLIAAVGGWGAVWWEKRHPSAFTRQPEYVAGRRKPSYAEWLEMSTAEQAAYDGAVLEIAADAEDAGRLAVEALLQQNNALYRP
ncbi:hypothetical protein AB0454_22770 [Streptomyces sp. NPDC093509]|uniref:hypothetical protein n=1 Tax=Streptomyces sp. NPDC093509 TaxID=3154982 RepID=UPI00344CD639